MKIDVEKIETPDIWDQQLKNYNAGIFMSSAWLTALSNNERKPVYLRLLLGSEPVAVLGGLGIFIGKGPAKQLLFYSGIASRSKDPSLMKSCKLALYEYAGKNGYKRISMKSYDHHSYVPAKISQFKEWKRAEYIFYLDRNKEVIINGFDKDFRRRARKAKRDGLIIKNSNSSELTDIMLKLINETYEIRQQKGYGQYSYTFLPFFEKIQINKLINQGHASFYLAQRENEILSIQLVFSWEGKVYGIYMGTSANGYKLGAPSFLLYEIVGILKDKGYSYYNIGGVQRSPKHSGLRNFKDSLGSEIVNSSEEATNFSGLPLSFLNLFLDLKRFLLEGKIIPWRIAKLLIYIIDIILNKKDKY